MCSRDSWPEVQWAVYEMDRGYLDQAEAIVLALDLQPAISAWQGDYGEH
jgi:hypothetical protein